MMESIDRDFNFDIFVNVFSNLCKLDIVFSNCNSTAEDGQFKEGKDIFSSVPACLGFTVACAEYIMGKIPVERTDEVKKEKIQKLSDQISKAINIIEKNYCSDFLSLESLNDVVAQLPKNRIGDEMRNYFKQVFSEFLKYDRLGCYMFVEDAKSLSTSSRERIKGLVLLRSSGTISASILNSIQSPQMEYTFLQLYQCLEYLFKLNNCFLIATGHSIPLEKSIDIVLTYELKVSESENLYSVLKNYASETSIDAMISAIPNCQSQTTETDKFRIASNYIYRLRCNIAHLRYNQDNLSNVDWSKCVDAIIEVIYSVYQQCDSKINQICMSKNAWKDVFPL